jgi:polysaccharide biosynthesis protein PslA
MTIAFLLIDVLIFILCGGAESAVLTFFWGDPGGHAEEQIVVVFLSSALYLLLSYAVGGFSAAHILDRGYSLRRIAATLAITFVVLIVIGAATKTTQNFSRAWFFSWVALSLALMLAARRALLSYAHWRLARGDFVFRALSVGVFAKPLSALDLRKASDGQTLVSQEFQLASLEELGGLAEWIAREEIDQIYIVTPWVDAPVLLQRVSELRHLSAAIFVLPDDDRVHALQFGVGTIADRLLLRAAERPINGWSLLFKRFQDVVVASAALVALAPVLALVALAIKLDSPGPVLFRQKRVGFNGRQFELLKFRSMHAHAADAHASRQTGRNDDRVTRVGRFIRKTSLDEMPQFLNVLRGEMSVVGPRPHALLTKAGGRELCDIADDYAARHRVKPGLTGLAQVNGCRGELDSFAKVQARVKHDIRYIENWSTWLDIRIILRTALLLVYDPAAY